MSTKVLAAPIHSTRWTSCGVGQGWACVGVPLRSTMYVPIRPVKNMISVTRKNHMASLPFCSGRPMWVGGSSSVTACAVAISVNLPSLGNPPAGTRSRPQGKDQGIRQSVQKEQGQQGGQEHERGT